MNGTEKVVKHLEMIQAVIKRLAINSFLVKGGSIVFVITSQVLFVSYVFSAFHEDIHLTGEDSFAIAEAAMLIFFIFGFWILDGFFLWQERLFRHLYDTVRKQDDTDFNMDIGNYKSSWLSAIFSGTLVIFYTIEIVLFFSYQQLFYLRTFGKVNRFPQ